MNSLRSPLAAALALTLLVAAEGTDASARWAPAEGEAVEWRWTIEQELELVDVGIELSGRRWASGSDLYRDEHGNVVDRLELRARDRLVERDADGPVCTRRTLERAGRTTRACVSGWRPGKEVDEIETVSPLEGAALVFARDERTRALVADLAADYDEREGQVELLDGLDESLDLRALLGGRVRRPGDVWSLDEVELGSLLRPGGTLGFAASEPDFVGEHESAALGWLLAAGTTAGEVDAWGRAEHERVVVHGGRRCARIALRCGFRVEGDVRERLRELANSLGSGDTWLELTERIDVTTELRLDGVLHWDLERRRAASLDLHGSSEVTVGLDLDLGSLGYGKDWRVVLELEGTTDVRVEAARVE